MLLATFTKCYSISFQFKPAEHMVIVGNYPADGSLFDDPNNTIGKLICNEVNIQSQRKTLEMILVTKESSGGLGLGFICGFLENFLMDIFLQWLEQEYRAQVITTTPTVPYMFEYSDGSRFLPHLQIPESM